MAMDKLKQFQKTNRILLVIMVGTLAFFGGVVLYFSMEFFESVNDPTFRPTQETFHQLGLMMVVISALAGLPAVGFGAYVMYVGSRIRITGQWPPAGMGFRTHSSTILGSRAGWIGMVVMGLGLVLIVAGLGLPIFGWELGQVLQGSG